MPEIISLLLKLIIHLSIHPHIKMNDTKYGTQIYYAVRIVRRRQHMRV